MTDEKFSQSCLIVEVGLRAEDRQGDWETRRPGDRHPTPKPGGPVSGSRTLQSVSTFPRLSERGGFLVSQSPCLSRIAAQSFGAVYGMSI